MTALGYTKLPSKYNRTNGIDGIYAKRDIDGTVLSLVIIENKVDQGKLFAGQMSDTWISEALSKMETSTILGASNTAREVRALIDSGSAAISKELWQHDLATGITTVRAIDAHGKPGAIVRSWQDSFIKNQLVKICRVDNLQCSFAD
jgi:hypothetical protein